LTGCSGGQTGTATARDISSECADQLCCAPSIIFSGYLGVLDWG